MKRGNPKIERLDQESLTSLVRFTFPQIVSRQAERLGTERIAIREKAYGIWQTYNWRDYLRYMKLVCLGLISIGLKRGEHVGLVLDNSPEWLFSELGAQAGGAVTVNLFTSALAKELVYGLNRIQSAYVIVQDQEQVGKLLEFRDDLHHVRRVIYIDPKDMRGYMGDPWLISFSHLMDMGKRSDNDEPELFFKELWEGRPDDIAMMLMTSGTKGLSKLVMLSYANITEMACKWLESGPIGPGDNWMSMTPTAWIVEQMWGLGIAPAGGITMNFPETLETIDKDLREIGPTIIITSPRFWEDLASRIRVKMREAGLFKKWIYARSRKIGEAAADLESEGRPLPARLKFLRWLYDLIVARQLLDRIGCLYLRAAYTGGDQISPDVIRFFRANGLNLKQCYGLTEAGGIFQVQPDGEVRPGTVGKPLPRTEIKIADDQEVLVSSGSNFVGYYQNREATAAALKDGWLHTGDAGYIDVDGHLLIIGRKEDVMRTEEGEAYSPDLIETRLRFSPYIREAVIWGEGRPYLTAFINIDFGNTGNWAGERKIPYSTYTELSQKPEIEEMIRGEVREVNNQMPDPMRVRKILLLYKLLDADDEELTRTGKVRRKFLFEQYRELIDAMYSDRNELPVRGLLRYRDGHLGTIETRVRIISI